MPPIFTCFVSRRCRCRPTRGHDLFCPQRHVRVVPVLLALLVVFSGCAEKKSEESASKPGAPTQAQPSESAPGLQPPPSATPDARPNPAPSAPPPKEAVPPRAQKEPAPVTPPPAVVPEAKAEPARPQEPKLAPTSQNPPQRPVAAEPKKVMAKELLVLRGPPLGVVRLEHKLHADRAGNCNTCHHASRPEKPATAPQQACSDCHTKMAVSPMKTKYQAAFHNPTAQTGTCVDCHKAQNAKGKKAPVKCTECHKKENP
jgi:class III cytochrome C family protein